MLAKVAVYNIDQIFCLNCSLYLNFFNYKSSVPFPNTAEALEEDPLSPQETDQCARATVYADALVCARATV